MSETLLEQTPPTEKEYMRWRILNGWSKEYIDEWMNDEPYYFFDFLKMERKVEKEKKTIREILQRCKY